MKWFDYTTEAVGHSDLRRWRVRADPFLPSNFIVEWAFPDEPERWIRAIMAPMCDSMAEAKAYAEARDAQLHERVMTDE